MANFNNLLNSPLPSETNKALEDIERELMESGAFDDLEEEGCGKEGCGSEGCGDNTPDFTEDSLPDMEDDDSEVNLDDIEDIGDGDDDEVDDLSDADLAALDRELSGETIDALNAADDEDDSEVKLSPEEEIEADDMMGVAATTMLVNDELNAEEKVAFLSNDAEVRAAINEGFMTEADVNSLAAELDAIDADDVVEEGKYNNRMIIKLSLAAKKQQLYALAVNVSAAAHQDRDYIKLKKVMKMRKILRTKLRRKYHAEAMKRARIYLQRLNKSKSDTLRKIAANQVSKKK